MLDRLYRALLALLPNDFDGADRAEMWDTYVRRVESASERGGSVGLERTRELGDLAKTVFRFYSPFPSWDALGQDVRFGIRSLRSTPGATALAVTSLALGLGAVTAIFSTLDVWLIRPLPMPNAERVVAVGMANPERGWTFNAFSVRDYADWSSQTELVELGVYSNSAYNLTVDDRAERISVLTASANLIDIFGIEMVRGRGFLPEDARPDAPRVVVITEDFLQSALGGDPQALERPLILDGVPHDIVGVMHPEHDFPATTAGVWRALPISGTEPRGGHSLRGVALLGPGVGVAAAREELRAIAARVVEHDPNGTFPSASVRDLREAVYGQQIETGGKTVGWAVFLVLLIACANIANILVARGVGRTHEIAVRGALGAGRARVVQQLLVESLLIAAMGGVLGYGLAHVLLDLLVNHAMPEGLPGVRAMAINARMLGAAAALTILSALVFGLVPSLRASRVDVRARLSEGGRGAPGRSGRLSRSLVIGEISVSMVLLVLSGLMIKAMVTIQSVDLGIDLGEAVVFRIDVAPASQPSDDEVRIFQEALAERLASEPGVTRVAYSSGHPIRGWSTVLYSVPGFLTQDDRDQLSAEYRRVSASYADVMGLTVVAGRWFDRELDTPDGAGVAVVSRELAERWWASPSEAIGRQISPRSGTTLEIVGVIEGPRLWGPTIGPPPPSIFEPAFQRPSRLGFWVAEHEADPTLVVQGVRRVVRDMDPTLAVFDVQTTDELLSGAYERERAAFRVFGALGALALLLTLVGVYGVMAHAVGSRMHEMGLRMALGADRRAVVGMVLSGSVRVALIGLAIGLLLSTGAGQGLAFMLAGVSPRDPAVLGTVPILVLVAVAAASLLPALRAASADPVRVMRGE